MNVTEAEAATLTFYRHVGCDQCNQTGYRGRVGIYEIMSVTDELRRHIALKGSETALRDAALAAGMTSLGEDGLLKVKAGVTTPQELLRVVTEVRETKAACPSCGAVLARDFVACPACGHSVGIGCPHCGRPMQPEWKFCPYCAKGAAAAKRGSRKLAPKRKIRELPAGNDVDEFEK